MVHDHLGDACSGALGHDRQEAVLFGIDRQALDDFPPKSFQRAARVVDRHAGDEGDHAVGEDRGHPPQDEAVLAALAPAGHDVVAALQLGDHRRDVRGIVLQVAVHRDHDLATRLIEAGRKGCRLPIIAGEAHDPQVRVALAKLEGHPVRAIGRAVVNQDQLPRDVHRRGRRKDLLVQDGEALGLVVDRHHDG